MIIIYCWLQNIADITQFIEAYHGMDIKHTTSLVTMNGAILQTDQAQKILYNGFWKGYQESQRWKFASVRKDKGCVLIISVIMFMIIGSVTIFDD